MTIQTHPDGEAAATVLDVLDHAVAAYAPDRVRTPNRPRCFCCDLDVRAPLCPNCNQLHERQRRIANEIRRLHDEAATLAATHQQFHRQTDPWTADLTVPDVTEPEVPWWQPCPPASEWVADAYPQISWLAYLSDEAREFYQRPDSRRRLASLFPDVSALAWEALLP